MKIALFAGEDNNIALWRLAQESKESPLCLPAQVFTHTFDNIYVYICTNNICIYICTNIYVYICTGPFIPGFLVESYNTKRSKDSYFSCIFCVFLGIILHDSHKKIETLNSIRPPYMTFLLFAKPLLWRLCSLRPLSFFSHYPCYLFE